jgi:hypothetical protein
MVCFFMADFQNRVRSRWVWAIVTLRWTIGLRSLLKRGPGGTGLRSGPLGGGGGGLDEEPESRFHTKCHNTIPITIGPKAITTLKS